MTIWRPLALLLAACCMAAPAAAHPAPGSALALDFRDDGVAAELLLPIGELSIAFGTPLAPSDVVIARHAEALKAYVLQHIGATAPDGRRWQLRVDAIALRQADGGGGRNADRVATTAATAPTAATAAASNASTTAPAAQPAPSIPTAIGASDAASAPDVAVKLWLQPPPGAASRSFWLDCDVIADHVPNHTALVFARSDWTNGVFSDRPRLLGTLHYLHRGIGIDRAGGSDWRGFAGVVQLGMHHIADGTDHLLFLLVLLLPAVLRNAGGRWGGFAGNRNSALRLLQVTAAFTLGHSAALLAGTLGWLAPPPAVVETLIALSILVSALHAARPLFAGREAVVAGAFGLVHGLAFAATISALGLDGEHTALAIFGFNVGIEAMQLVVLALALPWFVLLACTGWYAAFRLSAAGLAAVAAAGWVAERAFGLANPVNGIVESIATHPVLLFCALVGLSLAAVRRSARRPDAVVHLPSTAPPPAGRPATHITTIQEQR